MKNICGVVILFNPLENYAENIKSYLPYVQKLFIIDNSEKFEAIPGFLKVANIVIIQDGQNKGIGTRLNDAAVLAKESGYKWMLTMDQDSYFQPLYIENYIKCLNKQIDCHSVAMFGVEYENELKESDCSVMENHHVITSGSVVNLELWEKIGGFDEALFIDEVDTEYCYRARLHGFKIISFKNIFLNHQIGAASIRRSFKNLKKTDRALHSPLRLYYMVRNHLYVKEKYEKHFPEVFKKRKKDLLVSIKNNLLYGKNRTSVVMAIIRAGIDFKKKKMGKRA